MANAFWYFNNQDLVQTPELSFNTSPILNFPEESDLLTHVHIYTQVQIPSIKIYLDSENIYTELKAFIPNGQRQLS